MIDINGRVTKEFTASQLYKNRNRMTKLTEFALKELTAFQDCSIFYLEYIYIDISRERTGGVP